LRKGFTVFAEAELFLLHLDLVGDDDVSWRHLDGLFNDRDDKSLDDVLLSVVNAHSHMGAFVNLVAGKRLVGNGLVVGD